MWHKKITFKKKKADCKLAKNLIYQSEITKIKHCVFSEQSLCCPKKKYACMCYCAKHITFRSFPIRNAAINSVDEVSYSILGIYHLARFLSLLIRAQFINKPHFLVKLHVVYHKYEKWIISDSEQYFYKIIIWYFLGSRWFDPKVSNLNNNQH